MVRKNIIRKRIKGNIVSDYESIKTHVTDAISALVDIKDAIHVPYMNVGMISGIPESSAKKMWKLEDKDGKLIISLLKHLDATKATLERQLSQLSDSDESNDGGNTTSDVITPDAVFAIWNRQRMALDSELKPLKSKFKTVSRSYQQYINIANGLIKQYPDNKDIIKAAEGIIEIMEDALSTVPTVIDDYINAYKDMGGEVNGVEWKVGDNKFKPQ